MERALTNPGHVTAAVPRAPAREPLEFLVQRRLLPTAAVRCQIARFSLGMDR